MNAGKTLFAQLMDFLPRTSYWIIPDAAHGSRIRFFGIELSMELELRNPGTAPDFVAKCVRRVTQDLVSADVKIASRQNLSSSVSACLTGIGMNEHECEAASYYEKQGLEVIRLEHFASSGIGYAEHSMKECAMLGEQLRRVLPRDEYARYIHRPPALRKALVLNGVDPKNYSIASYPPDFLVVDHKSCSFRFVEVKGPKDRLHFRQANWFINLMPKHWKYEIFASINQAFQETFLVKGGVQRAGPMFKAAYESQLEEVRAFRAIKRARQKFCV